MESGLPPHPTIALKNIYALSLALLSGLVLSAQTTSVGTSELQYKSDTKLYYRTSTNQPYTGYAYSVNYYSQNDTTMKQYYSGGKMDWQNTYSNKKIYTRTVYYNHGLKNDSICHENFYFDVYSGDTATYEYSYLDKKKVKWLKQFVYQAAANPTTKKKRALSTQSTFRYYTRTETKDFTDYTFKDANAYDSAGYHTTCDLTGYYAQYYNTGKVMTEGMNCRYEQRIANKGGYNYNYYYGYATRCGTWKYYGADGIITREEVYKDNVAYPAETTSFYPDGSRMNKLNYDKKGSELKLPPTVGITVGAGEIVKVSQTTWHKNGVIASESFTTPHGDIISYSFSESGRPLSVTAFAPGNKPYGVHKNWDVNGKVTDYTNYSIEWNDTICYRAENGNIQVLNLRDRSVPMNWTQMPAVYYGTETKSYLYKQVTMYKQFHPNGRVKSEVVLKNGQMNGQYREYDEKGVQILQANYKADVADGAWTEWYSNGKVKKSFTYKNGMRNGSCIEYYSSGSVKWENIYVNGVPGKPKAYSENGTLLASETYLDAFYPPSCIETQAGNVRGAALHYYFMDTTLSRASYTIPDSAVKNYTYKVIAATNAITPGYDMCDAKSAYAAGDEFDIYHSCFVISKSLYTDANLEKIKKFLSRNGMQFDKTAPSENPVLGLEKEYLVYYSSKQMLNKQLVIDSLEAIIVPRAIDAKQGYMMSIDNNVPEGSITGAGSKAVITSDSGYSTIVIESGVRNNAYPQYPQYNTWKSQRYVVYDDLTCDVLTTEYASQPQTFWAGR